jgi:hypothetical protein
MSHAEIGVSPVDGARPMRTDLMDEASSLGEADVVLHHRFEPVHLVRATPVGVKNADFIAAQVGFRCASVGLQRRYEVSFRAQADGRRSVRVGCRQNRRPFADLGAGASAFRDFHLTTKLQRFRFEFVAAFDEDDLKLVFELGGSEVPVEISEVQISEVTDGDEFD